MAKILKCDLHDYLEIACLYQYRVKLYLNTGEEYVGIPLTTTTKNKQEFLVFCSDGEEQIEIDLLTLKSMHVLTNHAKFTEVKFN